MASLNGLTPDHIEMEFRPGCGDTSDKLHLRRLNPQMRQPGW